MMTILNPEIFSVVYDRYKRAIHRLQDWGVSIHSESRLRRYESDLKYLSESGIPASPRMNCDLAFSLIEADEIVEIESIESDTPSKEVMERLYRLPKDPYIRTNESNAPGRNLQFELYIRALLIRSGLECTMGTPDLNVSIGNERLQLEAKRPMSANGVDQNLREALGTLNKDRPGVIAMSLDHVLLGKDNVIQLENNEVEKDGLRLLESTTTDWLSHNKSSMSRRLNKKRTAQAMLFLVKVPIFNGRLHEMSIAHHIRLVKLHNFSDVKTLSQIDKLDASFGSVWGKNTYR